MNSCILSGRAFIVTGGVWPGAVLIYTQLVAIQAMSLHDCGGSWAV